MINTSKFENNFNDYLSPLREIILEKIQRVQDLSVKISNLIDEHDDFTAEETLSIKLRIMKANENCTSTLNLFRDFC